MDKQTLDNAIDRYLTGMMPEAERSAFRTLLEQDPEAAALVDADRLISKIAGTKLSMETPGIVPSAALLRSLSETRPRRRWEVPFAVGSFTLLLGMLLYWQSSFHGLGTIPHPKSTQSPVTAPQNSAMHTIPSSSAAPITKTIPSAATQRPTMAAPMQKSGTYHDLDEQLGKPRIFSNDSVSMKIHTK